MSRLPSNSPIFDPADILDSKELSARLKVNKTWIYNQMKRSARRRANPLPAIKMTRYLRFSWKEVCAWLESKRVKGGTR